MREPEAHPQPSPTAAPGSGQNPPPPQLWASQTRNAMWVPTQPWEPPQSPFV